MNHELEGYVIYSNSIKKSLPFAVVNNTSECIATSNNFDNSIKDFLVLIEDKRFYSHSGIDYIGICRAIVQNVKHLKISQGGSSLTQQLARNILRNNSKTISRKMQESFLAIKLENKYSKDEILIHYLNNVYFGKNIRGIRAAALHYFSKELSKLSQSEVLILITLLRGPNLYIKNTKILKNRYLLINEILYRNNAINKNIS